MSSFITTEKIDETDRFYVLLADGTTSDSTSDYGLARAWAHKPGDRVVLKRTTRFICEDPVERERV